MFVSGPPDALFEDLRNAPTPEAAARVEEDIWASWLESGSATVDILMQRGIAAQMAGDIESAREFYDRAIQIAPDYAEAFDRRATLFLLDENYGEAILDLNEVIRLEPRHFGAWTGLATIFEALGAPDEAISSYEEVLKINPQNQQAKEALSRLKKTTSGREI